MQCDYVMRKWDFSKESDGEVIFLPCPFVGWFVSRITQKLLNRIQ